MSRRWRHIGVSGPENSGAWQLDVAQILEPAPAAAPGQSDGSRDLAVDLVATSRPGVVLGNDDAAIAHECAIGCETELVITLERARQGHVRAQRCKLRL